MSSYKEQMQGAVLGLPELPEGAKAVPLLPAVRPGPRPVPFTHTPTAHGWRGLTWWDTSSWAVKAAMAIMARRPLFSSLVCRSL
jgi:hypothetical protein